MSTVRIVEPETRCRSCGGFYRRGFRRLHLCPAKFPQENIEREGGFAWIPWAYCLFKVMKRSRNTEKVRFFALWWKSVTEENGR